MRHWQTSSRVVVALLIAGVACAKEPPPPDVDLIPLLSLSDTRGQQFDPASLAGKPVLVNFWSTTCSSCIHEMPSLQAAADQHPAAELILVAIDGTAARAEATARSNGVRAPVLVGGRALVDQLGIRQVPTTLIVDREGRTRRMLIGEREAAAFTRALAEL